MFGVRFVQVRASISALALEICISSLSLSLFFLSSFPSVSPAQDAKAFKGDQGDEATGKVHAFWFATDKAVHSSRLKGALDDGPERNALWQRLIEESMPRVRELQAKIEGKAAPAGAGNP